MTDLIIDLLENALISWRTKQTRERKNVSLNSFSEYLGVSRPLLSMWLLGKRSVSHEYKIKIALPIANLIGPEIYKLLDVQSPDPDLQALSHLWPCLSEETRHAIREQAEKYVTNKETNHENALR